MDHAMRLIDLIPRRKIVWTGLFTAGAATIAGLEGLYVQMPQLTSAAGKRLAMFDLATAGSLGAWFSSLVLLASAVAAILIYSIRRHKVNDYQGHYRIWLWAASLWFFMATDVAANLHDAVSEALTAATGTRLLADGAIWWAIPALFLLGAVGSRLLLDTWPCRLASAVLLAAAAGSLTASAARFGLITLENGTHQVMLQQGALMVGHLLLLTGMGLYGRYVILDAEGLLPKKAEVKKAAKKAPAAVVTASPAVAVADEPEEEADEPTSQIDWVAVDPPHGKAGPLLKRVQSVTQSATPATTAAAAKPAPISGLITPANTDAASSNDPKLSKADRKALKKRLLEERLRREQRKSASW